jgi:hypothetical protein
MRRLLIGWGGISHGQQYAALSVYIMDANGKQCKGFHYQTKQQNSGYIGVKIGKMKSKNRLRYCGLKLGRLYPLRQVSLTFDYFRQFSVMSPQFSLNPTVNEVGCSGSLTRSS